MEKIRMAVIGIGTMGKKYAKMIQEGRISGMCLGAVCCRSHESSQWAKAELGGEIPVFQDTEKLFEASELFDACLIVTPCVVTIVCAGFASQKSEFPAVNVVVI